ncbi:TOBE domain-containing protein [Fulvivirgaceae bacterium BMA12]|uniref:TOBE domain-containing protein n=1 Tax=Agaribacillus aureus TaxID=3051825 RepID=A0ABT8L8A0_9BACT|nr:TOBE domain-containing protein [Fulvivirgaceae bacterium BMA12]
MNVLPGTIKEIITEGDLSLVKVEVLDTTFKSIVVENPQTSHYLKIGHQVNLLFKETEVVIGLPDADHISLQNRMLCEIQHINKGKLLSDLSLSFKQHTLNAVITSHAVEQLKLQPQDQVVALIKTNEIMLSPV